MKLKHNKKRNTAFLFEALCKELTKAVVEKDDERKSKVLRVIKEGFKKGSVLNTELEIYKSVLETEAASAKQAERVFREAVRQYELVNKETVFEEQSALINNINKGLGSEVFNNFVPSYTAMATAHQLFHVDLKPKQKVILEEKMVSSMVRQKIVQEGEFRKVSSDKLVYKTYVRKFNETFKDDLLEEQKSLLNKFINSFSDNGLDLKVFLNEEVARIRSVLNENEDRLENHNQLIELVEGFKGQWITTDLLKKIIKLQSLAGELQTRVN
jgi:hypothetical protein